MGEVGFGFAFFEAFGGGVAPAAFDHEGVPDFDLFRGGPVTGEEAAFEDFFVGAALLDALEEVLIGDLEEGAEAVVEGAFAGDGADGVSGWEISLGLEACFVDEARDEDNAGGGIVGAADGEVHGRECSAVRGEE